MKYILSSVLCLCLVGSYIPADAQQEVHRLEWIENSSETNFPTFEGASYGLQNPHLPLAGGRVRVTSGNVNAKVRLTSIQYADAGTLHQQQLVKMDGIGPQPKLEFGYGKSQEGAFITYTFLPFVKVDGTYKRITSYRIVVETSARSEVNKYSAATSFVQNSILATGDWYKFSVANSGIYKITPQLLSGAGMDINGLPVQSVRIVGNGGGILPTRTDLPRKDDLQEVSYQINDRNGNGLFDANDYLLIYAEGPHIWKRTGTTFNHQLNPYRDKNYYFISINSGNGRSIPLDNSTTATPSHTVHTYDDYAFKDDDLTNLVGAGKRWVGEVFDFDLQNNYGFNFPDLDNSEPVNVKVSTVARVSSNQDTYMNLSYNGMNLMTMPFSNYSTQEGASFVTENTKSTTFSAASDNFTFLLEYNNNSNPSGVAWLDYIEVQVRRNLIYRNKALLFRDSRSVGAGNVAQFVIDNVNQNVEVWDVTDVNQVVEMNVQLNGQQLTFTAATDSLRQFVAVSGSDFPTLDFEAPVENQNLHSMTPANMYIIAHKNFLPAAEELADFHINHEGRSVKVVRVDQIFNEFSSGGQDITAIRDFMRMIYQRNSNTVDDLKYLMLFGDASYDYRDRISNNNNYVPTWQNDVSFSLYNSTVGDDYYGSLDPGEGGKANLQGDLLDIGIGRLPCGSLGQAQSYVDKVVNYVTGADRFGDWRNKILFMADDIDKSGEGSFVRYSEHLEDTIQKTSDNFHIEKIYLDAYNQVSTSGSESYPEANKDMFRKVQQGNLITNYIGHGGEIGLTAEKLMHLSDINGWTNFDALPLFMTITCEFTRFDDPKRVSAGEQLIMNPRGGAIATVSTTRVVFVGPSAILNKQIFSTLLTRPGNVPRDLGQIIMDAKNKIAGDATRLKFSLFGDPSIKLAIPYYKVQTNSINGKPISTGVSDTLKALDKVTMTGQVNDLNDQKISDFTGVLNVSVFDKPSKRRTLMNDGLGPSVSFNLQNSLIYKGKVEVINGDFTVEFIVPKDIAYQFDYGKISYYAENGIIDAAGVFDTIWVGGNNSEYIQDEVGPVVELYINDESFVRGGITGEDPELYAVLSDSSGINTVGNGVGHDLVAVLDNNAEKSYVVNEYYEADLNSYQSGKIRYPLFDLETGNHSLDLKVFDIHNNFTMAKTDFVVAEDEDMALDHVLNYPNPFTTYTEFQFEHNRANQPLDIQVQIFTVSGKLVKTINESVVPSGNRITGIAWNGLDDYGDKIGKGVYVYRVKVRSSLDQSQAEKYEKLVILR